MSAGALASIERASAWWATFDLSHRRGELEGQQADVMRNIDTGAASLRHLIEFVKDFRKGSDVEKIAQLPDVLKAFQDEVTTLTKRAKYAEKNFLQIYTSLAEAPDPGPTLATARDMCRGSIKLQEEHDKLKAELVDARSRTAARGDQAEENARLRGELRNLEAELSKLQNQDITIRELEQRIGDFESLVEDQVAQKLAARESELRHIFEAELEGVREGETASEARLYHTQAALADAIAARDEAQAALFAARSRTSEVGSAETDGRNSMEYDAVLRENDSLVAQISTLTTELAVFKHQLVAAIAPRDGAVAISSDRYTADPLTMFRNQVEGHKLRAENAEQEARRLSSSLLAAQQDTIKLQQALDAHQHSHEGTVTELRDRIAARDTELSRLTAALAARPTAADMHSLRSQYQALQLVAMAGIGDDVPREASDSSTSSVDIASSGGTGDVLEIHTLMMRKIKQLESKLLQAERQDDESRQEVAGLRQRLDELSREVQDRQGTIERLEDVVANSSLRSAGGGVPEGCNRFDGGGGQLIGSRASNQEFQLAALLDSAPLPQGVAVPPSPAGAHGSFAAESSHVVDVLRSQRDRFRSRTVELENEVQHRTAQVADAMSRMQQVTQDNVKLYEKIRYLQGFLSSAQGKAGMTQHMSAFCDHATLYGNWSR